MKYPQQKIIKILSAKEHDILTPYDLDLWSDDPNLYMGHLSQYVLSSNEKWGLYQAEKKTMCSLICGIKCLKCAKFLYENFSSVFFYLFGMWHIRFCFEMCG